MNRDEMIKSAKETVSRMDPENKDIKLVHAERFFAGTVIVLDYFTSRPKASRLCLLRRHRSCNSFAEL